MAFQEISKKRHFFITLSRVPLTRFPLPLNTDWNQSNLNTPNALPKYEHQITNVFIFLHKFKKLDIIQINTKTTNLIDRLFQNLNIQNIERNLIANFYLFPQSVRKNINKFKPNFNFSFFKNTIKRYYIFYPAFIL